MIITFNKLCHKCKEYLESYRFYKKTNAKDGLAHCCKACLQKVRDTDEYKNQKRDYYLKNKERFSAQSNKWQKANRPKVNSYYREYNKKRLKEDSNFKLARNLRIRLNIAIKYSYKEGSAVEELGCSIKSLKKHLESKFKTGMTWDNYGKWHIDHIRPLASFNLEDIQQLKLACNYTNLQPLWAADNLKKSNKI